jgi:adenine-specific DNA-methyltransferase
LSSVIPAKAGIQSPDFEITKEPSVIERLAYKDTWAGGTDSYLDMLYPRLQLIKRLLAPDGSIYVHLDWHVGHYVKVLMDEIPGLTFCDEIIWHYADKLQGNIKGLPKNHDIIFRLASTPNLGQQSSFEFGGWHRRW